MNKKEFIKHLDAIYGEYTAFVYDTPSNRYTYVGADVDDDLSGDLPDDFDYNIDNIGEFPRVKEVICNNFISELEPAYGVDDEYFNEIKSRIESGNAEVGWWYEDANGQPTYTYILIL